MSSHLTRTAALLPFLCNVLLRMLFSIKPPLHSAKLGSSRSRVHPPHAHMLHHVHHLGSRHCWGAGGIAIRAPPPMLPSQARHTPGCQRSHGTSLRKQVLPRVPSCSWQLWKKLVSSCDTASLSPTSLILSPQTPALPSEALKLNQGQLLQWQPCLFPALPSPAELYWKTHVGLRADLSPNTQTPSARAGTAAFPAARSAHHRSQKNK